MGAYHATTARSDGIQGTAEDVQHLSELFKRLHNLVVEQDGQVQAVEQNAEDTGRTVAKGTAALTPAIKSAQRGKRAKWWLLWIGSEQHPVPRLPWINLQLTLWRSIYSHRWWGGLDRGDSHVETSKYLKSSI